MLSYGCCSCCSCHGCHHLLPLHLPSIKDASPLFLTQLSLTATATCMPVWARRCILERLGHCQPARSLPSIPAARLRSRHPLSSILRALHNAKPSSIATKPASPPSICATWSLCSAALSQSMDA